MYKRRRTTKRKKKYSQKRKDKKINSFRIARGGIRM